MRPPFGGVPEWTNGAVLKTVEGAELSVGSNPTPSAIENGKNIFIV